MSLPHNQNFWKCLLNFSRLVKSEQFPSAVVQQQQLHSATVHVRAAPVVGKKLYLLIIHNMWGGWWVKGIEPIQLFAAAVGGLNQLNYLQNRRVGQFVGVFSRCSDELFRLFERHNECFRNGHLARCLCEKVFLNKKNFFRNFINFPIYFCVIEV